MDRPVFQEPGVELFQDFTYTEPTDSTRLFKEVNITLKSET